jgi:hypothetical protein
LRPTATVTRTGNIAIHENAAGGHRQGRAA